MVSLVIYIFIFGDVNQCNMFHCKLQVLPRLIVEVVSEQNKDVYGVPGSRE